MPARALALIIPQAPAHDAALVRVSEQAAEFRLTVTLLDGRKVERRLAVTVHGDELWAREPTPEHLPAYCPERHINSDASFCLGWSGHESKSVIDDSSATLWWGKVIQFFRLQERATRLRRWPDRHTWAHGAAAPFQRIAEISAAKLGETFATALQWGRLTVSEPIGRSASNGPAITLSLDERRLLRVWCDHPRLVNMRQPCVCDHRVGRPAIAMRGCHDHAQAAVDLVRALVHWRTEERSFWNSLSGQACCGTLDECPLKVAADAPQRQDSATPQDLERRAA